ncbi:MAG: putative restriction enzyme, partial [Verrucomicrobiales bacterium]|nr:putative restriction enzyme [Verrucomicrobiales bacterium]
LQDSERRLFSSKTFELLDSLGTTPTVAHYNANKDAFKLEVENPLKMLFDRVRQQMPRAVLDTLETEKRIVARFHKDDFGKGGAHSYLWGAFYPKESKRTESAQLFVTITRDDLEVGFSIGDYGSGAKKLFIQKLQANATELASRLEKGFSEAGVKYGVRRPEETPPGFVAPVTFVEWANRCPKVEPTLRVFFNLSSVVKLSESDLVSKVSDLFLMFFPLALVVLHNNPLPHVDKFLRGPEEADPSETISDTADIPQLRPVYSIESCAAETGYPIDQLTRWVRSINRKGQAIVYGPPGTGKTFVAEKLAAHLTGGGDGVCELVQFHPAYSYEDFIEGIRPINSPNGGLSYPLVRGTFLEFCAKAQSRNGISVLIVDEINRANVARVFGELMYLLEYRNREVRLAGGTPFQIPKNVRLIGTMNTADRSIALVDHALRRRFAFLELIPNYEVLAEFHSKTGFTTAGLIKVLTNVNKIINDKNYHIGISFFLRTDLKNEVADIWNLEIEPYLEEFFFDQPEKLELFRWDKVQNEILS